MVWSFPQTPWGVYLWPMQWITSMSRVVMSSMARPWPSPVKQLKATWEKNPPPLDYNVPEGTSVELPVDFEFVPYLNGCARDITLSPSGIGTIQPPFPDDYINDVNDEAWLKHVHKVLAEKQGELQDIPMTYSGFFSHCHGSDNVRPRATVGVFLVLILRKSSINGNAKTCNAHVKKVTSFVNPGQILVIVGDCHLYGIQKKCQWRYPLEVGNRKWYAWWDFYILKWPLKGVVVAYWLGLVGTGCLHRRKFSLLECQHLFSEASTWNALVMHPTYSSMVTYAEAPGLRWTLSIDKGPSWNNEDVGKTPCVKCPDMWLLEYSQGLSISFVRGQRAGDWPLTLIAC